MKILFDHPLPFMLARGGFEIQLAETKRALEELGVKTEDVRSSDATQTGDVIHYFSRPDTTYIELAHGKGIPVVMAELLTSVGSRSRWILALQGLTIRSIRSTLPAAAWSRMGWEAYKECDKIIALTAWEATLMRLVFGALPEKLAVIPNGVSDEFFTDPKVAREDYLVCTATITARKRVLELAQAAAKARTPLWIVGQAYSASDPYAERFVDFAQRHKDVIRYEGAVNERSRLAEVYRRARGFVLLSAMESLSLSALEAAACGCPLLLSDLPWARSTFGETVSYCPANSSEAGTARVLRAFYDKAAQLPAPPPPARWIDVANQLKCVYEEVLSTSR